MWFRVLGGICERILSGRGFLAVCCQDCEKVDPEAKFLVGDIRNFQSPDMFDTVVMLEVLEHLDDPHEVIEMHNILKADLIVPLDKIILTEDTQRAIERKITETIQNTELLLDNRPNGSTVVGPIQGTTISVIKRMVEKYEEIGIKHYALGGLVFQKL